MRSKEKLPLFSKVHLNDLEKFVKISAAVGNRPDYVQSGGGNTSVKLAEELMAIKASGTCISDITITSGYAVGCFTAINTVYETSPQDKNCEEKTAKAVEQLILKPPGIKKMRPSVEIGFHSLLNKFVIHTHPVYANLLTCTTGGRKLASVILKKSGISHLWIDYVNPGAFLTFTVKDALLEHKSNHPDKPVDIIFLQNHGFIATSASADECISLHNSINTTIAQFLNLPKYPAPSEPLLIKDKQFLSTNEFLIDATKDWLTPEALRDIVLYPDQLVYLNANTKGNLPRLLIEPGKITYNCALKETLSIEQSLLAYAYIVGAAKEKNLELSLMPPRGISFIEGWEAEKYRKSVSEK